MWSTIVKSLTDKPENYPVKTVYGIRSNTREAIRQSKSDQTENLERNIKRAVKHYGEATIYAISAHVKTHSTKYLSLVCNKMHFKGMLDFEYKKEDKNRRKYWRLT
jgi:hypothetical protein